MWIEANTKKFNWFDCTAGVICSCGEVLVVDSQNEPVKCECGKKYRMSAVVEEFVE